MKWPLNAMLILAGIFLMFLLLLLFFASLWSFLIAIAIRSSQLSACLMKHHYIITGILGRVSGKPASQLFLIARHTHNWAFYQVVQIPALSCNIPKDCVFFSLHMKRGGGVGHDEGRAQHPKQGTGAVAFALPLIGACGDSASPSHWAVKTRQISRRFYLYLKTSGAW